MINRVVLSGRLTKDPELKKTPNDLSTVAFTLAIPRIKKEECDFVQCVAWRQSADYLCQYAHVGDVVEVEGRIQTRNYDKNGQRVYVTEVIVDSLGLVGSKKETKKSEEPQEIKFDTDALPFY